MFGGVLSCFVCLAFLTLSLLSQSKMCDPLRRAPMNANANEQNPPVQTKKCQVLYHTITKPIRAVVPCPREK